MATLVLRTLGGVILVYVGKFKYLGQIIPQDLKDVDDIERERRYIAIRWDVLILNSTSVQTKLNADFLIDTAIR